jgi:hypothetical protein
LRPPACSAQQDQSTYLSKTHMLPRIQEGKYGLDHGVGHSLLLLYDVKAPNGQKSNEFKDLGHYPSNASLSTFQI